MASSSVNFTFYLENDSSTVTVLRYSSRNLYKYIDIGTEIQNNVRLDRLCKSLIGTVHENWLFCTPEYVFNVTIFMC